ncbi:MAG: phage tail protein [Planctomycetota bacterium]
MAVDISIDPQEWTQLEKLLGTIDATKVAKRATKDVAKTVRTRTARRIQKDFTLKYGDVLKGIKVGTTGQTGSRVELNGPRRSLHSFRGSPKKPRSEMSRTKSGKLRKARTYRYEIEKGRKREAPAAFVQRPHMGSQPLPFKRMGRGRLPIVVLRGPSVPAVWQAKNRNYVAKDVLKGTRELLQQRIRGQAFRLIQQQMRSTGRQVERLAAGV